MRLFDKLLRVGEGKKQKALASLVPDINALEPEMEALTDAELQHKTVEFRERIDRAVGDEIARYAKQDDDDDREPESYETRQEADAAREERRERFERERERLNKIYEDVLNDLLIEAFAATREAARRTIGQRHYDVQMMGGAALHFGWIAEMKTGEGKTLVSTLPVYLNGLTGRGLHVVTVNDYLAQRDAQMMGRIHQFLGLSVGMALPGMDFQAKRASYQCDVTYGTNTEFGFDYLRDNMALSRQQMVQREHIYAIVDEVDSILIDEARTPLIISGPSSESAKMYYQFASIVRQLQRDVDYEVEEDPAKQSVSPTEEGIERVERALGVENLYDIGSVSLVHQLQQALVAKELKHRDKDYILQDGEVKIVDEFTGRILEGRRWSDGLHQAVEAKERVKIQEENHTWATVTLQNYFRLYRKIAGMTGTAETEAAEFTGTYGMPVVPIPTHRPMVRFDEPDLVYKGEMAKFSAVVDDLAERQAEGQPVLVGTASVAKSELLSKLLRQRGVPHEVLNAKQHAREAEIVAQAGRLGAVTVATNMAGRGVDILLGGNPEGMARKEVVARGVDLGSEEGQRLFEELLPKFRDECVAEGDEIRELGGLYVLGTERHESRRIDNQLRGRSGRQGDPGESRFYLSLEDDLMRLFATGAVSWVMGRALPDDVPIEANMVSKAIERAQGKVESVNAETRKDVLKYDAVMNEQRKVIYARRMQIIDGDDLRQHTIDLVTAAVEGAIDAYTDDAVEEWDPKGMLTEINQYYPTRVTLEELEQIEGADEMVERFSEDVERFYEGKEESMPGGAGTMRELERAAMLRIIDQKWRDHLAEMDYLKQGIHLRQMGQQDPLVAWQREGFQMFTQLMTNIDNDYARQIMHVQVILDEKQAQDLSRARFQAAEGPVQSPTSVGMAAATSAGSASGAGVESPQAQAMRDEPADGVYVQSTPIVRPDIEKIGRNDPCYCGSGKKYKNCHGKS